MSVAALGKVLNSVVLHFHASAEGDCSLTTGRDFVGWPCERGPNAQQHSSNSTCVSIQGSPRGTNCLRNSPNRVGPALSVNGWLDDAGAGNGGSCKRGAH